MHVVAQTTISDDNSQLAGDRRQKVHKNYRMAAWLYLSTVLDDY
ncbi:MAG: hypothetical protein JWL62_2975 [Hyphomicrobiales bacterium]|nr:hypothetical protein [Hyphomicrobiales bacterium]